MEAKVSLFKHSLYNVAWHFMRLTSWPPLLIAWQGIAFIFLKSV